MGIRRNRSQWWRAECQQTFNMRKDYIYLFKYFVGLLLQHIIWLNTYILTECKQESFQRVSTVHTGRTQNAPVPNEGKVGAPGIFNLRTIRRFVAVFHVPATLLALRILSYT
jgi:hypothetical protein